MKTKREGEAEDEMVRYVTDSVNMNLSKLREVVEDRGAWHAAVQEITKSRT